MLIDLDESYASQILDILNHAIVHTTALYDYQPRPLTSMTPWFAAKRTGNYPVVGIVAEDDPQLLRGFASYGPFRERPAYKYTIEHSVYVHPDHRRKGLARQLLAEIIHRAEQQEYHALIAGIDAENDVSIHLHRRFGFSPVGSLPEVAFKFGRWLTLEFYQLTLTTPSHPMDG